MDRPDLTLQEAADELGVHYMTAYRYVRLGVLPAEKAGGVWRVRHDDLARCREDTGTSPVRSRRPAPWAERLESRLVAGDARGAWGVIEAALSAGAELDEVYLDVLTPAMVGIGAKWEAGEIDVAIEHRATGIAMRLIGRLGPRFVRRGRSRGTVVLGAPAGERHSLPVAVLGDLLRLEGWEVSDLGADTPAASFALAAGTTPDVVAVGLSVTHPEHLPACAEAVAAVRSASPELLVLVGGQAIHGDDDAAAVGAHAWASSAKDVVRLIQEHTRRGGRATDLDASAPVVLDQSAGS